MVWVSTEESLKNKEVSFLAIVEIIVAVGIYWGIAVYYNTYIHFLISIFLTPILLLSSKYSQKKGVYLLNTWSKLSRDTLTPVRRGCMMILTQLVSFLITFSLSYSTIGLVEILLIFIFASLSTSVFLVVFTGKQSERISVLGKQTLSMYTGVFYGFILNFHWYSGIVTILIITILIFGFRSNRLYIVIYTTLVYLNPISLYISIIMTSYLITIYSIFRTLKKSLTLIPENWKYNSLIIDFNKYPELMPGIELSKVNFLKFSTYTVGDNKLLSFLIIGIPFFPAILYRLSIKSTFWFYIPLLFVVKKPSLDTSEDIGKFLSELYQTTWVKVRGLLALITLGAFFVTYFEYYSFRELEVPSIAIIGLLYLDFSSIEIWKTFQLLVALLTIGLFFYANAIRVPYVSNNIPLKNDVHVKTIFYLNSIRNWLSLFYLLSAFIFLAVHLKVWEYEYVPNFFNGFLIALLEYIQYIPFK